MKGEAYVLADVGTKSTLTNSVINGNDTIEQICQFIHSTAFCDFSP